MKNKIIVSFLAVVLWACSDGSALKLPEPSPTASPVPPAPVVPEDEVTVTPAPVEVMINKFEIDPAVVKAGEAAKLCWDVSPADAVITVVDGKGNSLQPDVEAEDGGGETSESAASFKSVDCVTVYPLEEMSYTLTATTADGSSRRESTVTVKIAEVEFKIVSFKGNGQEGALILDEPSEVRLTWEVVPEGAIVTISPAIAEVTTELSAKGSATVRVDKTTTYTLTASFGERVESRQLTVNVSERGIAKQVTAVLSAGSTDIFAGEEVTLSWSITTPDGSPLPADALVTLNGERVSGNSLTIRPAASGSYVLEVSLAGSVVRSNQVGITVRSWKITGIDGEWSGAFADGEVALFGKKADIEIVMDGDKAKDAIYRVGRLVGDTWSEISISYGKQFKDSYLNSYHIDKLATYNPFYLNAFAKDQKTGRIYGAMTGMLIYSDSKGAKWGTVDIQIMARGRPSEHVSCFNRTQVGDGKEVANLRQICDVLVDEDRVLIGTDHGAYYIDGVDEFMRKKKNTYVCWRKFSDGKCADPNGLSGTVVNNLESFGGMIYAGTAKGVWISSDRGDSWTEFNGGGIDGSVEVYTLAIDASGKRIYAGGPSGVYVTNLAVGVANWERLGGLAEAGVIYSLAIDHAAGGAIYAGTENGVFISRDFGVSWVDISESMAQTPTVYGLAVSNGKNQSVVYAATSGGVFSAIAPSAAGTIVKPETGGAAQYMKDMF